MVGGVFQVIARMFMAERNLGPYEFAVSRAMMELQTQHEYINAEMVAGLIGCHRNTVYTSIKRLRAAGKLRRLGGHPRSGGYRYEITR